MAVCTAAPSSIGTMIAVFGRKRANVTFRLQAEVASFERYRVPVTAGFSPMLCMMKA